jgi:hypothetical protein
MVEALTDVSVTCDDGVSILVSVSDSTTVREILQQVIVARKSMSPSLTLTMEECAMSLDNGGSFRLLSLESKILSSQNPTKMSSVGFKITVFGYRSKAEEVLQSQKVHDYLVNKAALELRYLIQSKGGLDQSDISYAPSVIPFSLENFRGPQIPASDVVISRFTDAASTQSSSQSNSANIDLSSFDNECSEKGLGNVLVTTKSSIPNRIESLEALVHEQYLDFTDNVRDLFHDSGLAESNSGRALMEKAEELMQLGDVCGLSSVIFEYERTRQSSFSTVSHGNIPMTHNKQDTFLENAPSKTIVEIRRGFEEAISRGSPRHQRNDPYSSAVTGTELMDRYTAQKSPEYHTQEYRRSESNPPVADKILFGGNRENRENPVSPLLLSIVREHSDCNTSSSSSSSSGSSSGSSSSSRARIDDSMVQRSLECPPLIPGGDRGLRGLPLTGAEQATQLHMSNISELSSRSAVSSSDAFDGEMIGGNANTAGAVTGLFDVTRTNLFPLSATDTRVSIDGIDDEETACSQYHIDNFHSVNPSSLPTCGVGDDDAVDAVGMIVSSSEERLVTATHTEATVASANSSADHVVVVTVTLEKQLETVGAAVDAAPEDVSGPSESMVVETTLSTCALTPLALSDEAAHSHTEAVDSPLADVEIDPIQMLSTSDSAVTEEATTESVKALADESALGSEYDDISMLETAAVAVNEVLSGHDECTNDTQDGSNLLHNSAKDGTEAPSDLCIDTLTSEKPASSAMSALLLGLKRYSESGSLHSNKHPRLDPSEHEITDAVTQSPSRCSIDFNTQMSASCDDGGQPQDDGQDEGQDERQDAEVSEGDGLEKMVESSDGDIEDHLQETAAHEEDCLPEEEICNDDDQAPVESDDVSDEVPVPEAVVAECDDVSVQPEENDMMSRLTESDNFMITEDFGCLGGGDADADAGAGADGEAEVCEIEEEVREEVLGTDGRVKVIELAVVDAVVNDDIQPILYPNVQGQIESDEQLQIDTAMHVRDKAGAVNECTTPSSVPHEDEDIAGHDQDHNQLSADSDDDISVPVPLNYVVHADVAVGSRSALGSQETFYEETSCEVLYGSMTSVIKEKVSAVGELGRTISDFTANGDDDDALNEADWLDDDITIPSIGKMLDGRLPFTTLTDTVTATGGESDIPASQGDAMGLVPAEESRTQDPGCELPCGQLEAPASCDVRTTQEESLSANDEAVRLKLSQLAMRRIVLELRKAAIMKDEFCADDASSTDPSSSSSDEDCSVVDYSEIEVERDTHLDGIMKGPRFEGSALAGHQTGQKGVGSHRTQAPSAGASTAARGVPDSNTVGSALQRNSSTTSNMSRRSLASNASSRVSVLPTLTAETLSELRRRASTTKMTVDDASSTEPSSSSEDEDEDETNVRKKLTGKRGRESLISNSGAARVTGKDGSASALTAPPASAHADKVSSTSAMAPTRSSKSSSSRPANAPSESAGIVSSILPCPATPLRASARLAALPSAINSPYNAKRSRLNNRNQEEEQSVIPDSAAALSVLKDGTVMATVEVAHIAGGGDDGVEVHITADDVEGRTADDDVGNGDGDADDGGDDDDEGHTGDDSDDDGGNDSDDDGDNDDHVADPDYEEDDGYVPTADDSDDDADDAKNDGKAHTADNIDDGGDVEVPVLDEAGLERGTAVEQPPKRKKRPKLSNVELIEDIFGEDVEEDSLGTHFVQCWDAMSWIAVGNDFR